MHRPNPLHCALAALIFASAAWSLAPMPGAPVPQVTGALLAAGTAGLLLLPAAWRLSTVPGSSPAPPEGAADASWSPAASGTSPEDDGSPALRYTYKGGVLQDARSGEVRVQVRGEAFRKRRRILDAGGDLLYLAGMRPVIGEDRHPVHAKEYILQGRDGTILALARPDFTQEQPRPFFFAIPHVDHAALYWQGDTFQLRLQGSRDCLLEDPSGRTLIALRHQGLSGGWTVHADGALSEQLLCATLAFFPFLEEENEV